MIVLVLGFVWDGGKLRWWLGLQFSVWLGVKCGVLGVAWETDVARKETIRFLLIFLLSHQSSEQEQTV